MSYLHWVLADNGADETAAAGRVPGNACPPRFSAWTNQGRVMIQHIGLAAVPTTQAGSFLPSVSPRASQARGDRSHSEQSLRRGVHGGVSHSGAPHG